MRPRFVCYILEFFGFIRAPAKHSALLVLFISVMLVGQSAQAENLMEVYRLAQENDPTFQGERFRHEASSETLNQAYSELLPTLNADGSYGRTRQKIFTTDVAVFGEGLARYPSKSYNLTLTQPLFRYSSIMRVLQAKEDVKRADFEFEAAKQDLILRVAESYIGALEAQDNIDFTRAEEGAVELHFELAQGRFKSGLAPITDFHDAKARLANVTALRVRSENRLDDSLEALAEIAGQNIENPARLKSAPVSAKPEITTGGENKSSQEEMLLVNPDPDDINNWIDAAFKHNFSVEVLRQAVLVAKREVDRQSAGHWPTVSVVGRLNREDEDGSLFGGASDVGTREAMLQVNVPIFQGFAVLSKTREARKLHKAAKQDLEKETRAVKRRTRAAFLGVKSSIKNTEAFRQSVLSNGIALEAKREGFKSGLFPSLAVLDAVRDLHKAKLDYANAQYEYILEGLRLKKAVGTLNEDDLAGLNKWFE